MAHFNGCPGISSGQWRTCPIRINSRISGTSSAARGRCFDSTAVGRSLRTGCGHTQWFFFVVFLYIQLPLYMSHICMFLIRFESRWETVQCCVTSRCSLRKRSCFALHKEQVDWLCTQCKLYFVPTDKFDYRVFFAFQSSGAAFQNSIIYIKTKKKTNKKEEHQKETHLTRYSQPAVEKLNYSFILH